MTVHINIDAMMDRHVAGHFGSQAIIFLKRMQRAMKRAQDDREFAGMFPSEVERYRNMLHSDADIEEAEGMQSVRIACHYAVRVYKAENP